ncbi:hypothetical protein [Arthrobacter sp. STN4]|uniref:hypothetical protein n=1 Tax=Arthrobacter sp. STN4 TaxID=2923276 RepID=UPI00211A6693|nr:hypothetical protein [Arthrobacter sp. STN4]MCQ9164100.1 hypothetical protein [Arthrobacter sp. STN4]
MALMIRQQNERELAIALEQRRLLRGADGADPRFHHNPSPTQRLWQRLLQRRAGSHRVSHTPARGGAVRSNA